MTGQRLADETDWTPALPAGAYWRRGGRWYVLTPNGLLGDVTGHAVTEHEDRTITVSPSILVNAGAAGSWHGYLERGVWRAC